MAKDEGVSHLGEPLYILPVSFNALYSPEKKSQCLFQGSFNSFYPSGYVI